MPVVVEPSVYVVGGQLVGGAGDPILRIQDCLALSFSFPGQDRDQLLF